MKIRNILDDFNIALKLIGNYIERAKESVFPEEIRGCYSEARRVLDNFFNMASEAGVNPRDYQEIICDLQLRVDNLGLKTRGQVV